MEWVTLVVVCVHAIGYVVAVFIQKNRIKGFEERIEGLKDQIAAMDMRVKMYDPEKVAKHVENMQKGAQQEALNLLYNKPELRRLLDELIQKNLAPLHEIYSKEIGNEYYELFAFAYNAIIQNQDDAENLRRILNKLPTARAKLLEAIKVETGAEMVVGDGH